MQQKQLDALALTRERKTKSMREDEDKLESRVAIMSHAARLVQRQLDERAARFPCHPSERAERQVRSRLSPQFVRDFALNSIEPMVLLVNCAHMSELADTLDKRCAAIIAQIAAPPLSLRSLRLNVQALLGIHNQFIATTTINHRGKSIEPVYM